MKENWLDQIRYGDIVELVHKICLSADNISVLLIGNKNGDKKYEITYKHQQDKHEMHIGEFGEIGAISPYDNEEFFKIARKKNKGRKIDGKTFEESFVEAYQQKIDQNRDLTLQGIIDAGVINGEVGSQEYNDNLEKIRDVLNKEHRTLLKSLARFIDKHKIKLSEGFELSF